ncbi:MAG: putative LPS assembly protein LptD [Prolixibacteraceae bacterium]|nr:putative LPS assembly protein LptD [Prolixibacteraceae bacterium]
MRLVKYIFTLSFFIGLVISAVSQDEIMHSDSALNAKDLTVIEEVVDTVQKPSSFIESPINYDSKDSMAVSMEGGQQTFHLYGGANIKYGSIELDAAYISVNFESKEIYAEGITDSLGNITGKPHFKEGNEEFDCRTLRYNFATGKGFTEDVVTEQQDGIVRSSKAKMLSKDVYCMIDGKYSTCDAEHPHFYLNMTKGKVLREKAIITGLSYLVLEDFPIYFPFLPYGFIPTFNQTYSSGVIIPSYGEEGTYGFYLKNGGFYWAANDYFDLKLTGDIYSGGKWAVNADTKYRLRYKYSGNFRLSYSMSKTGERGIDLVETPNFSVAWSHSQDTKSNPSQTFSARVNFSTSGYDKEESYEDPNKFLQNSKSSTVSFRKTFLNSPFSLSASVSADQNTKNQSVSVKLPSMTVNMKSIQPFKRKNSVGKKGWYEDFKISYSTQFENKISTTDSLLFRTPLSSWQKGVKHSIPITLPSFNVLNHINVVPSISTNARWYFNYNEKYWVDGYQTIDSESGVEKWIPGEVKERRVDDFKMNYEYAASLSATTTLYGMYTMKNPNSKIIAVRHKMDPSISLSYHPDFGDIDKYHFYEMVQVDSLGNYEKYNIFQNGIYGYTSEGESGSINFGLSNNIEMKMLNDKDTTSTEKFKKIAIFDNLSFRGSYNLAAEQYNLSTIGINARTKIAGTSINVTGTLDPYRLNKKGVRQPEYNWNYATGLAKLGRITNVSTGFSLSYSSDKLEKALEKKRKEAGVDEGEIPLSQNYTAFNMPWRISGNYSFNYSNRDGKPKITQSLGLNGGIDLTPKWTTTFSSGFDFVAKEITHTNVSIIRNLHCWTMSFNFSPVSTRPYYTFTISANSSMLKDLKLPPITDRDF